MQVRLGAASAGPLVSSGRGVDPEFIAAVSPLWVIGFQGKSSLLLPRRIRVPCQGPYPGDRRRNERLVRLRSIVRRDYAIVVVESPGVGQAGCVVADHDSIVLGRRMFSGDAPVIDDDILDWAEPIAAAAGSSAGVVLGCEPTWPGIGGSRCWTAHAHVGGSWCA